jgi:hypothetical protein
MLVHLAAIAIIGAGLAFRLSQYFSGRSMWLDEASLALNVLDRSIGGLSHQLDFGQGAPLGFLVIVKVLVVALGKSEAVLRLFPLLCGIGALPLMYVLARRVTSEMPALIALVLFAAADGLIYYSTELKQYSSDVLLALAISAVAITPGRPTVRRYVAVCALAAAGIWISHVVVFFAAAVFVAYVGYFVRDRDRPDLVRVALPTLGVLVSFALFYVISFRDLLYLEAGVGGSKHSGGLVRVVISNVGEAMALPFASGGLPEVVRPLALASALAGALFLLRSRIHTALILGLPLAFAFAAMALHRYPTFERTLLFFIPAVCLFVAHGIYSISRLGRRTIVTVVVGAVLTGVIVEHPVAAAARHLSHPRRKEEVKPLLRELVARWRPGDTLYVFYSSQYALRYYVECGCAGTSSSAPPLSFARRQAAGPKLFSQALRSVPPHLFVGVWAPPRAWARYHYDFYRRSVRRMFGRGRVWFLFSHANTLRERHFEEVLVPGLLNRAGNRLVFLSRFHAQLFLYDLPRG